MGKFITNGNINGEKSWTKRRLVHMLLDNKSVDDYCLCLVGDPSFGEKYVCGVYPSNPKNNGWFSIKINKSDPFLPAISIYIYIVYIYIYCTYIYILYIVYILYIYNIIIYIPIRGFFPYVKSQSHLRPSWNASALQPQTPIPRTNTKLE